MRAVIQRVSRASVEVEGKLAGAIEKGVLIFLGVEPADATADIDWLVNKVSSLRVFEDEDGKMNVSLSQSGFQALVVSQFTLYGNLKKGSRPSFNRAALPKVAIPLYESFVDKLAVALEQKIPTGVFGAHMNIECINDGPVTLIVDTKNRNF